ncbi:MAG: PAC2 family protein [Nanoarchaeota archaeon]|nr:PAC2 family protein [Nanoarchaeota archaeon]
MAESGGMEIKLKVKPKGATLLEGFPGFGFVGTIATGFLIEHMDAKLIGKIEMKKGVPMVAVHNSKVVEPFGIYYSKRYNLVILTALTSITGMEWEIAEAVEKLCKQLEIKEVISLEGVASQTVDTKTFFYCSKPTTSVKFKKLLLDPLGEGVIMGVTGALMSKEKLPMTCLFASVHSKLPDSRAAAKLIEVLDQYLGLKVDYKPLLKKATEMEGKLKGIMQDSQQAAKQKEEKEMSYFG